MSSDLEKKVQELTDLVKKQSQVIAKTGKQVMEMQFTDVKKKMALLDALPQRQTFDIEDYATNEDILQLVCELQGQLDYLEERTIARNYNGHISASTPATAMLAPLRNRDGAEAPPIFPQTKGKLEALSDIDLFQLCEFYELIVANETSEELKEIIKSDDLTPEDAAKLLNAQGDAVPTEQKLSQFTREDLNKLYDEFTRYIGARVRRGAGW